jgi:hypothetical protein
MKTIEESKEWWEGLSFEGQFYKVIGWLSSQKKDTTSLHPDRVTDEDIQNIYSYWILRKNK